MEWTQTVPTEPGWYWCHYVGHPDNLFVARVDYPADGNPTIGGFSGVVDPVPASLSLFSHWVWWPVPIPSPPT